VTKHSAVRGRHCSRELWHDVRANEPTEYASRAVQSGKDGRQRTRNSGRTHEIQGATGVLHAITPVARLRAF
jgi:hypothetical protein